MIRRAPWVLLVVITLLVPAQSSTALSSCRWVVVPNPGAPSSSYLNDIVPISAGDAWAVGSYFKPGVPNGSPLAEHWNGQSWTVSFPAPAQGGLEAMSAVPGKKQLWAVGWQEGIGSRSLVERQKGNGWRIVPSPIENGSFLADVVALSAKDVWAVGEHDNQPLIEHWDGHRWSTVPTPSIPGPIGQFNGVAAISTDDIYAMGATGSDGGYLPLIEQWDGDRWSVVSDPPSPQQFAYLLGVSASSPSDVWAVGSAAIDHFDGSAWTALRLTEIFPLDVKAFSATNVWIVGLPASGASIEHWNGSSWREVKTAGLTAEPTLIGVSALNSMDIWAVGQVALRALIERRSC